MDTLKRVQMLRTSVSRTMERLDAMDSALEKADQEVASLDSQIAFWAGTIGRLKKPGIIVSMDEYSKIRIQLLHLEDKKSRVNFEAVRVRLAMTEAERMLSHEQKELAELEA